MVSPEALVDCSDRQGVGSIDSADSEIGSDLEVVVEAGTLAGVPMVPLPKYSKNCCS